MAAEPWPRPREGHLGARTSAAAITSTVAPLLAGFSVTLAAVVVADNEKLRWPGLAALLATLAAISLISAIQLGATAQAHNVSPANYVEWFGDAGEDRGPSVDEMNREHVLYEKSATPARRAFNLGIFLLYSGLASALVPQDGDEQARYRLVAAICAFLAAIIELWFTVSLEVRYFRKRASSS
jgi:hypothetical protein